MEDQVDPTILSLSSLRYRCAEESDRFFRRLAHDARFCFELFRRAVLARDQHAWELIYRQYQPLVAGWVERHSLFHTLDEDSEFFVNGAFAKMWAVMTPEKFAQFADLKSVLRYLQMCVHSVIVDTMRGAMRDATRDALFDTGREAGGANLGASRGEIDGQAREEELLTDLSPGGNPEATAFERLQGESLWRWLEAHLKSEKERRVVYGCFILALKPGEVFTEYQGTFRDVKEVYLVKENVLARLRRDEEFQELLGGSE